MTLNQLRSEYNATFDMVLHQMDIVKKAVTLTKQPYMRGREAKAALAELNEEARTLKELNRACQMLDQMLQDKYTVREMYVVQMYKLSTVDESNPYNQ